MGKHLLKLRTFLLIVFFALACAPQARSGQTAAPDIDWKPLVVHFDKNSYSLKSTDKNKIKDLLNSYDIAKQSRIFVVGHTDTLGKKKYNYRLSHRRAQNVKKLLIETLGLKPEQIIAVGKGPENPAADNRSHSGQAENRRVEIYMFKVSETSEKQDNRVQPQDPAAVQSLVQEARDMLCHQQLDAAIYKLHQGRALGGDQSADWHAVYGIAGFYAGVDAQAVLAHLKLALQLDPFQYEARDYLGRLEARTKVASGHINAGMGQSPDAPIAVTTIAQEHEFLALFQVQPMDHYQLTGKPVHAWKCRDRTGHPVTYYFERSAIHAKAFNQTAAPATPGTDPPKAARNRTASSQNPEKFSKIWESMLFR